MIYVVKQGDSLYSIAQRFGVTEEKLSYDNQLYGQEYLVVGQALLILTSQLPPGKIPDFYVTGYAYPFIEMEILEQALPYLNELLIFSYGFTEEGELVPPMTNDLPLIEAAWQYQTEPVLVLTPLGADGRFNNNLVHAIIIDPEAERRLINNLLATVQDRGYVGVDVDFEFVSEEDKEGYAAFVGALREVMNANGFSVSVALPPKTSAQQGGELFGGVDFRSLGENADKVFLMTYEWGYTNGDPLPVSPIANVREVLEYGITRIPHDKILMGLNNYGYDWPLPFVRGQSRASSLGNYEAAARAEYYGVPVEWDDKAMAPFFEYTDPYGTDHIVWFENERSWRARLDMVREFGLAGVSIWAVKNIFYGGI